MATRSCCRGEEERTQPATTAVLVMAVRGTVAGNTAGKREWQDVREQEDTGHVAEQCSVS